MLRHICTNMVNIFNRLLQQNNKTMLIRFIKNSMRKSNLQINKNYEVISIQMVKKTVGYVIQYRILNEHGVIALYNANLFLVVHDELYNDMVFKKRISGNIEIVSSVIGYDSFWEDFFNDEKKALNLFQKRFPEISINIF